MKSNFDIIIVLYSLGIFRFYFIYFKEKIPVYRDRTHVNVSEGYEVTSELPGIILFLFYLVLVRKFPFTGIELTSQRVTRLRGYLRATGSTGRKDNNTLNV